MAKKKIRIFISSPGDVQQERNIARKVISELSTLYSKYTQIEVLMWEDFPLTVDSTFQEGIDYFLKEDVIDIAVFILWSRLGTPLCSKFLKPDGTPYQSGTEYEYDLMWNLFRQKGMPRILTYVKTLEPIPTARNAEELLDFFRQQDGVKSFLAEHFHDESTNSNYAYLQFEEPTSFENKLRNHLKELILKQLGDIGEIREWDGNPYVGLNSFEYEQSAIFFGRKHLVYEITGQLMSDEKVKQSLIVLGESGSGKSSFVKAGLLPFLCRDNKTSFHILSPSMFGGKMYSGVIDLLVEKYIFLKGNPFIDELKTGISEETNFKYLSYAFSNQAHDDIIFYIDQFEELFSDNQITEEERKKVILLLRGLVSVQCISIFMSMRSDFYNRFSFYGGLAQLKEFCVVVDIPTVGLSEIAEIIEEPAKKACLKWEIDNKGNALHERIVSDAATIKDLPLIEFALSELYNLRDENNCLTFEAYQQIGELKGAIVAYANKFYKSLTDKERNTLSQVLSFVIAVSPSQHNTYVRKTSLLKDAEQNDLCKNVIKKLIVAHIFVTGKDHNGQPTVSIVHETLIKYWNVIQDWIIQQKDFLLSNSYYEQRAQHWINSKKLSKELVQERTALLEVEYFVYKYVNYVSGETKEYLLRSLRKSRRKGIVWQTMLAVVCFLSIICLFVIKFMGFEYDEDINKWNGINELSIADISFIMLPLYTVLLHSLILKYLGKPIYKTVGYSLTYWAVLLIYLVLYFNRDVDFTSFLVYMLPISAVLVSVVWDARRRWLWKTKKLISYGISDKWIEYIKSFFVGIILLGFILYPGISSVFMTQEKNEELEKIVAVADELFNGMNYISSMLSSSDRFYINEKRRVYLEGRWSEELQDTIPDEREFQYATCLYNLSCPDDARKYLYYKNSWRDHLLIILCLMQEGNYPLAELVLEEYVNAKRYDDFVWLKTDHLIWVAEKLGRFDLAEQLYELLEANNVNKIDPAYAINQGHIYLNKNEMDNAIIHFKRALELNPQFILNITQDLHTFSYFDVMDDALLKDAAQRLNVDFIPAFTQIDTSTTAHMYKTLHGDWTWQNESDSTTMVRLSINKELSFMRYYFYVYDGTQWNETNRMVVHIRFEETNQGILWDEYDPMTDGNSYGILEEINKDYFVLKIMENGNPDAKGTRRIYKRFEIEN